MRPTQHNEMTILRSVDEIPTFATEAEEAEFWDTHDLGEELVARMAPIPDGVLPAPRLHTNSIAVQFDADTLRRVQALAAIKHKDYQTLLKEFVAERLYEEEKREGLISTGRRS